MSGHTKGPWLVTGCGLSRYVESRIGGGILQEVAWCGMTGSHGDMEANARLIAAAPELLTVAEDFKAALGELGLFCECGETDCRTTRLRAALAKATGETK